MARALDVARYLIHLASQEEEPELLTHLRLQKLLYYVQGWSLAMRGVEMFPERIEAWAHGPVVRDLYSSFASYGDHPIPVEKGEIPDSLSQEDREFISSVWDAYRPHSAWNLREMTHTERPWKETRGSLRPADNCSEEITKESMRSFFEFKMLQHQG